MALSVKMRMNNMKDYRIIDITPDNIEDFGVCGYKDARKHPELQNKIDWFKKYYPLGLKVKSVIIDDGGNQGMIEYIPGKYAHRPVDAKGYMFINCIFVGFKKQYKGRGYATALIGECEKEAEAAKMAGVAVVTRKGSFMVDDGIFLKSGYVLVDSCAPDFHLLVKKFDDSYQDPKFKVDMASGLGQYQKGLTILRSVQCPYTYKNVNEIKKAAKEVFDLTLRIVDLENPEQIQRSPCPFGSFCMIFDGKIISHHPISKGRFVNIMNKLT